MTDAVKLLNETSFLHDLYLRALNQSHIDRILAIAGDVAAQNREIPNVASLKKISDEYWAAIEKADKQIKAAARATRPAGLPHNDN